MGMEVILIGNAQSFTQHNYVEAMTVADSALRLIKWKRSAEMKILYSDHCTNWSDILRILHLLV